MAKFHNTLSFRLTLWYALTFVVFLVFAFLVSYLAIESVLNQRLDDDLVGDVYEYRALYQMGGKDVLIEEIEKEGSVESMDGEFIRLLRLNGNEIFSSNMSEWKDLTVDSAILSDLNSIHSAPVLKTIKLRGQEFETRVVYGIIADGLVIQAGESLEQNAELMELLFIVFIVMIVFVIPFASVVSWFVSRRAVSGIEEVSRAAIDIKMGEFNRLVTMNAHSDEVQRLIDTFNAMATRIRSLVSEMREMIDNIAHDLRSPLARIRAISEASLYGADSVHVFKAAAADTIVECDRLIKLINTTLDVAEIEADVANGFDEVIDVSQLVEDACELFGPVAEQKNINLKYDIQSGYSIQGGRQNIQRMLANLLDNAIKYTPKNGKVVVQLGGDSQNICLAISNTGVAIPISEQHRVFERFYRCDQSRHQEGCGLGLSFSRAVARAHGGDITLVSIPDESTTFTVSLPIFEKP